MSLWSEIDSRNLLQIWFFLEKEKIYNRQISAPLLKRKTSRFGLGQFLSGNSNHAHINHASSPTHHPHHLPVSNITGNNLNHLHPNKYNHHLSPYPPSSPALSPHSPSHHFHFQQPPSSPIIHHQTPFAHHAGSATGKSSARVCRRVQCSSVQC